MPAKFVSSIRRNLLPACVLLVSLLITFASWHIVARQKHAAAQMKFAQITQAYTDTLQRRVDSYVRFLDDLSGLYESSNFVTSREFANFIRHANIEAHYPGTNRILYLPLVPADQKAAHEAQMRAAGFPDYRIKAEGQSPEYYPFNYLYPMDTLALQNLLGEDMHTEPNRKEAMQEARDTGQVTATAPLSLLEAPRQHASVVLFTPIYHAPVPPRTTLERRQALQGFVAAAFRVDTLVNATWKNELRAITNVRISDRGISSNDGLLYDSGPSGTCTQCLRHTETLQIGGRQWSLDFIAQPAYSAANQNDTPLAILVGGLLTSLLLTGMAIQRNQKRLLLAQQYQQNQKFRSLFDRNPDAVYAVDLQGFFVEVNSATAALTGVAVNELIGKSYVQFIASECLEDAQKQFAQSVNGTTFTYGEFTIINSAGERIEISTTNMPIVADNKVIGIFGVAKDITAKKTAEEESKQMRQFLDAALENLPTVLFVKEAQSLRFIVWNKASEKLTGVPREEIIGKSVDQLFPKREADYFTARDLQALESDSPIDIAEETVQTRHQGVRLLHTRKMPFWMGDKQYLLGISEDITERRQAEEALKQAHDELEYRVKQRTRALRNEVEARKESERALQESEEKYRSIFEQAPVGIAHMNLEGRWVKTNQKFCEIVGYSAEELASRTYVDITHPDDLEQSIELARQVQKGIEPSTASEKRYIRKDGSEVWVRVTRSAVTDKDHEIKYYLRIIEDITHQKETEAALRELTRHLQTIREDERARIAREIHDELGGVLAAVKFDLSIPMRQHDPDQSGLANRNQATIRLVDNAIVALRRIMADLRPSVLDDLGLWAALEWQATEFQARMQIQTIFNLKGEEVNVEPNRVTALFRIVQESLNNVAKHAQATAVSINATTTDSDIIIRIHDNGRGISREEKAKAKSFGLMGMHERAQAFGGVIKINSSAGKGTTVSIKFPISNQ